MKKNRFIYYGIFLLTVFDIAFTSIGLQLGIIEEANPIMDYFIHLSMILSIIGVVLYVGIAMIFLYKVRSKIPWLSKALMGLTAVKLWIMVLHVRWVALYFIS
ncbi:DUF5658 family protein [Natronincola ferrireducens]|uniref:DUF5658 domain-containing protein n=1 Tax=Natronincola ferrireducens TaxID=393762 RepID=A0A1G9CKR4_9FIRM|nr:DUF5658 family protein [Natronincola ferrireducens]SDK52186.1 hypothetical protein SAMN05660472_01490 [Natronincola ferrireducens]